jgi:hypothetical protein
VRAPPPRPGRNWGRAKGGAAAEEAAMKVENFIMNENKMRQSKRKKASGARAKNVVYGEK